MKGEEQERSVTVRLYYGSKLSVKLSLVQTARPHGKPTLPRASQPGGKYKFRKFPPFINIL